MSAARRRPRAGWPRRPAGAAARPDPRGDRVAPGGAHRRVPGPGQDARLRRSALAAAMALAVGGALTPGDAQAATGPAGYDVSYPQCGRALPAPAGFGIVGSDDGVVLSTNPCLGAEVTWARRAAGPPAFYANTGNPGPAYSGHWPAGQSSPRVCGGGDTAGCSYDYGWNAAAASFAAVARAAGRPVARSARWWLDVETANSWQTLEPRYGDTPASRRMDGLALAGEVGYLRSVGVRRTGVYSTAAQWAAVTGGGSRPLGPAAAWQAGAGDRSDAVAACRGPSFTGGTLLLAQYRAGGYDADEPCG